MIHPSLKNLVDYPNPPYRVTDMFNFFRSPWVIASGILVVAFAVPAQAAVRRPGVKAPPPTITKNTGKTFVSPK